VAPLFWVLQIISGAVFADVIAHLVRRELESLAEIARSDRSAFIRSYFYLEIFNYFTS
jgi:hypothetical protein